MHVDKWRVSSADVVESLLERQLLRILYVLHLNRQVFCSKIVRLTRLTNIRASYTKYCVQRSFAYSAHAIGNRPKKLIFERMYWSVYLCCLRYEKSTSKVRAKFSTSDIPLFKSDSILEGNTTKNEVDIFGLTKCGRRQISHTVCGFMSELNICNNFVSLWFLY